MGFEWDNRTAMQRSVFIMRILVSLFPLVFVVLNCEALPVQDKQSQTNEILTEDEKDLLKKMMTDMAELNLTSQELADLDPELLKAKLGENLEKTPKDKSPCKLFFWKTFSSC